VPKCTAKNAAFLAAHKIGIFMAFSVQNLRKNQQDTVFSQLNAAGVYFRLAMVDPAFL